MANKIAGLTIEIGGETTRLTTALGEVNKHSRDLKSELKEVEKLLKLDPGNAELLAQKQRLLAESVENTKNKLDTLKEAERQAQEQFARGEIGENQYRAIQREVIATQQELGRLETQLDDVNNKWKNTADGFDKFGKKTVEVGKGLTKNVTAPILAVGAASIVAFNEVDGALDTIVTKTGATGEAMEEFEQSFRNIAKTMPVDLQAVGDAIGEVNTQFGFTGEVLEKASEQMLKFAEINGQDVTSSSIASKNAMEAFGLSASDLDLILDSVTKTAQNTGVSTDKIFDSVVKGAPQLKSLGLDFSQSAEMMGRFEQKGLDGTKALSYMAKAQLTFAKDGITLSDGLESLTKRIINSKSETEQLTIASEYFGTKGASFMLDAVKRGALDFKDLAGAAESASGAVTNTFEEALDPIDKFKTAMNNIKLVGSDIATTLQEVLVPFMDKLVEKLQGATDWFRNLSPKMQEMIIKIALVAAAIGPLLIIIGKISIGIGAVINIGLKLAPLLANLGGIAGIASTAMGALSAAFAFLISPIGLAIAAVVALIAFVVLLIKHWDKVIEATKKVANILIESWTKALDWTKDTFKKIYETVLEWINKAIDFVKELPEKMVQVGKDIIQGIIDGIKEKFKALKDGIKNIADSITGTFKKILGIASPSKVFRGFGENVGDGLALGIKDSLSNLKNVSLEMSNVVMPNIKNGTSSISNSANSTMQEVKQEITVNVKADDLNQMSDVIRLFDNFKQTKRAGVVSG